MSRSPATDVRLRPLPVWGVVLAWAILLNGLMTLPLGYVFGIETSTYPTPVKILYGVAGALGGIGLLARRPRAPLAALGFLMTQIPTVDLPGFSYRPVLYLGLHTAVPATGGALELGVNGLALVMVIGVAALMSAQDTAPIGATALPPVD